MEEYLIKQFGENITYKFFWLLIRKEHKHDYHEVIDMLYGMPVKDYKCICGTYEDNI